VAAAGEDGERLSAPQEPSLTSVGRVAGACQHRLVLLAYLDESYTKDRFYIAAVIVPEAAARPLAAALDRVVADASEAYGVLREAELHGHPLMQGLGDWQPIAKQVRARGGVYDKAMRAIGEHDVRIVCRGLDIRAQNQKYRRPDPPHRVVLQHTMERVNDYARACGQRALLIADEVNEQDSHRQDLWTYQRTGTPGWKPSKLTEIVDTIHFAPSKASRLLQAADLVAYLHRRRETHPEADPRAQKLSDLLWSRVEPRVWHAHCWVPG
jgi:hypothetical protein